MADIHRPLPPHHLQGGIAAAVHVLHYTAVRGTVAHGIAVRGHQEVVARGAAHHLGAAGQAGEEDPAGAVLLVDGQVLVEAGAVRPADGADPVAVGEDRLVVGVVLHGKLSIDLT